MSGTELKSCPFCGSINVGFEDVGVPGEFQDFAVACNDCGAFFHRSTDGEVQSMEEVAAGWNRRDADSCAGKVLPIPCTNVKERSIKDWLQKINEELDEFKESVFACATYEMAEQPVNMLEFDECEDVVAEEAADTITAITSMLEAMGIDEQARQEAQERVNAKNGGKRRE